MGQETKAGSFGNVRKEKYASVAYWITFYTYTFLIATRYFIYEEGYVSSAFSDVTLYQHVALIASIIVGFAVLRKRDLTIPKRVLNVLASLALLFGGIFPQVRTNIYFCVGIAVLLGQLATCSLLTYIYQMNNAERLFGIVGGHLLTAVVAVINVFFTRETAVFSWVIFGLAVCSATLCFLEKNNKPSASVVMEEFQKKLHILLALACVGGFVSVCSSMIVIGKIAMTDSYARLFYYGGAALGAVVYYIVYRCWNKPASATLIIGFSCSVVAIALYFFGGKTTGRMAAVFSGMTFNFCMMNLYYILCNIIKKYRNSNMLKTAPILSNFVGGAITVLAVEACRGASEETLKVALMICIVGNVIILATSALWQKCLSLTAEEEQYVRYDTDLTRKQAYEAVGLTEKEMEVADMLAEGCSLKEIAKKSFVSENTAKTQRSAVYKKMGVSGREELIEKVGNLRKE